MLFLGLISSDEALCAALAEQIKRSDVWQLAVFTSLTDALESWRDVVPTVIFWDAQESKTTADSMSALVAQLQSVDTPPKLIVLDPPADMPFEPSDTYARPLRLGALLGRLQLYEKAAQQTPDQARPLGPWLFNPRRQTLADHEKTIRLTDKEAALLWALYTAPDGLPRDRLLEDVWGYSSQADTHTIETHIYRLRRKLMTTENEGADCFDIIGGHYALSAGWRGA